jgi:hypothetical protein
MILFPADDAALRLLGFSHGFRRPLQNREDALAVRRGDATRPWGDPFWRGLEHYREELGVEPPAEERKRA